LLDNRTSPEIKAMSTFIESVAEFAQTSRSSTFLVDVKKVCSILQGELAEVYLNDGDEIELVKQTIKVFNSNPGSHVRLESAFVHGNRSMIAFDYYGEAAQKELGDLIVVSTLTNHGTPVLQKMTIVQAKRDTRKTYSWGIDEEQLFFLSNWPEFEGVMGIFPRRKMIIPDYSGCLGSYYLYRSPGDFVFISAKELDRSLGSKKRITFDKLLQFRSDASHTRAFEAPFFGYPGPFKGLDESYDYFKQFYRFIMINRMSTSHYGIHWGSGTSKILGNVQFGKSVYDTIGEFCRLNIGEPIFACDSEIPVNEFAYRLLNTVIRYIARTEQNRLGQLIGFNADARYFEDVDLRGMRIGILHTITEVTTE